MTPKTSAVPSRLVCTAGDSLTEGTGTGPSDAAKNGGYRWFLQQALTSMGKRYSFTGTQQRGDKDAAWNSLHDGIAGQNQNNLLTQLQISIMPLSPEIILYLCGINDMVGGSTPTQALAALQTNLDYIWSRSQRLRAVILGELIPNADSTLNGKINTFNAALPAIVASYVAAGKNTRLAPLNSAVPYTFANFGGDATHPNPTGYQAMALNGWLAPLVAELS